MGERLAVRRVLAVHRDELLRVREDLRDGGGQKDDDDEDEDDDGGKVLKERRSPRERDRMGTSVDDDRSIDRSIDRSRRVP